MIKKTFKIIMVVIMVIGIAFSISNFFSTETEAVTMLGVWDDVTGVCVDSSTKCVIGEAK
jgi:hypothetical protein